MDSKSADVVRDIQLGQNPKASIYVRAHGANIRERHRAIVLSRRELASCGQPRLATITLEEQPWINQTLLQSQEDARLPDPGRSAHEDGFHIDSIAARDAPIGAAADGGLPDFGAGILSPARAHAY